MSKTRRKAVNKDFSRHQERRQRKQKQSANRPRDEKRELHEIVKEYK